MKKLLFPTIFSIIISIPILLPYFKSGYFPTHDGEWAVVRLADMYRTVKDFQIPARYSGYLNAGYGYPLFNFAYPFPYYLGLIPLFLGFGFISSIKLLFALSVLLSALGMFLFSEKLWKSSLAGAISAVLYIYAPYRFVDLFVRGSLGESLSFVLFPFILLLGYHISIKSLVRLLLLLSIALAFLVGTHNIMTILFIPVFLVFVFSFMKEFGYKSLTSFILSIFTAVLLSAFFWLPALVEKNLIALSQTPIANREMYFVNLSQLILPSWGYEPPTEIDGFTYQIGLPHIIVFLFSISLLVLSKMMKQKSINNTVRNICILLTIILFFMFSPSQILWQNIPLLSEINYPWTLLSQTILLISILAGFISTQKTYGKITGVLLSILAFILFLPYVRPKTYVERTDDYYVTNDAVTTSSDELMPLWVKKKPTNRPLNKVEIIGQGNSSNLLYSSRSVDFTVNVQEESIVRINTIYYPGWKIYDNENELPVSYNNEFGVMDVALSPGIHHISGLFKETPLRLTSNILSLVTFVFVVITLLSKTIQKLVYEKIFKRIT